MTRKVIFATALAALAALLAAAPAFANERWASPTGSGLACTEVNPCDLETATNYLYMFAGDEIIVKPGDYAVSDIVITTTGIEIHGEEGEPRPTITMSGTNGIYFFSTGRASDLNLVTTGFTAFSTFEPGTVIERVTVSSSTPGAIPCWTSTSMTVRDTVCRATGVRLHGHRSERGCPGRDLQREVAQRDRRGRSVRSRLLH